MTIDGSSSCSGASPYINQIRTHARATTADMIAARDREAPEPAQAGVADASARDYQVLSLAARQFEAILPKIESLDVQIQ